VRKWLRQAEVEAGQVDGTTTAAAREIRELKRKTRAESRPQHRSSVLSSPSIVLGSGSRRSAAC
jgi:transposase-like protein